MLMAKKEETSSFEELYKSIKSRNYYPIYLLMGEEPYFIDKLTDLLIDEVLTESEKDFNQMIFYGADCDAIKIINAARRYPMMSEYQLIVVREAQVIRNIDLLSDYLKNPLKSTILVLNYKYKSIDKRKSLYQIANKIGKVLESKKIPDYKLQSVVLGFVQSRKLGIDAKSTQMLCDYIGNDLSKLDKELDKLTIILQNSGVQRITPELIEENIGISKEYNNFELIRALANKETLKSNEIIDYFGKNSKMNPIQVTLSVLYNYFSNLLICYYSKDRSEQAIMTLLGLRNSYGAKEYITGIKNYSAMKAFNIINEIREADALSKGFGTTGEEDGDILRMLVYKILHL